MRTLYRYTGAKRWTSGKIKYDHQTNYEIKLTNVKCTRGEWGSCEYSDDIRWCDHEEDVFLSCHGNLVIYCVFFKPSTTLCISQFYNDY